MNAKKVAAVGGGILIVAALAYVLYDTTAEERPPIRVKNKKLTFILDAKDWRRDWIGEQWKPDHSEGDDVSTFAVAGANGTNCARFQASEVVLEVMIGGAPQPFRLYTQTNLDPFSKDFLDVEPKLDSPVPLETTGGGKQLKFRQDQEVWIARVLGDGQVRCTFTEQAPSIDLDVKPGK
jgi:hypothetical protein